MKRKIEFDREISDFRTFYSQAENVFQSKRVDQVYKSTAKYNGALGASGYNGPIYGELTQHSMHKLLEIMIDNCQLSTTSRFLDVGSGIGKPNLHALQFPGVSLSIGVEIEKLRWQVTFDCIALISLSLISYVFVHQLAMFNLAMLFNENSKRKHVTPRLHGINIIEGDISSVESFVSPFIVLPCKVVE
jgi:hypothetical protein